MKLVERRMLTTAEGLSTSDQAQLAVIGTLYFGAPGPVTIDDDFEGEPLAARVLSTVDVWKVMDGSTHAYDVWTYMGDSGTVFRAGSAESVAEVIQGSLECDDDALGTELDEAIYAAYHAKKKAKKKAAKKKPATKKPAAKKPAAKKPAAKKTAKKKPAAKAKAKTKAKAKAKAKKPAAKKRKKRT
jgi:hypothetical protein